MEAAEVEEEESAFEVQQMRKRTLQIWKVEKQCRSER